MLQQTQVGTVIPFFLRWMERFPSWTALAEAPEAAVLKAWEGLGYYRRARLLHALARRVVELPGGELPSDPGALRELPGIGPYTAGAIASIAFQVPAAAVDGNVQRVLARVFAEGGDLARPGPRGRVEGYAAALVRPGRAGDYTQALMELGALICLPREPLCVVCPVRELCARPDPTRVPRKRRVQVTREEETLAWIVEEGRVFLQVPGRGSRWPDFWKLPRWDDGAMSPGEGGEGPQLTYGITRFRVTARLRRGWWKGPVPEGIEGVPLAGLGEIVMPTPHRRLMAGWAAGQT